MIQFPDTIPRTLHNVISETDLNHVLQNKQVNPRDYMIYAVLNNRYGTDVMSVRHRVNTSNYKWNDELPFRRVSRRA